jgi:hypothetical protein
MVKEWIDEAKRVTFERFPEFRGIEPQVRERRYKVTNRLLAKLGLGGKEAIRTETILTFVREFSAEDGVKIKKILKVHIDAKGHITKFTGTR